MKRTFEYARRIFDARGVATALVIALCMSLGAAYAADTSDPHDISGVWWTKTYTPRLVPTDAKDPPYTAEGLKRYRAYREALKGQKFVDEAKLLSMPQYEDYLAAVKKGDMAAVLAMPTTTDKLTVHPPEVVDMAVQRCQPPGFSRALASPYPFMIVQSQHRATFLFEMNKMSKVVRLYEGHINTEFWDPSYGGESVGKWDRDTLVVDTINFNDVTKLDRDGAPHSDQLHTVSRFRKINGGKQLEALITFEDPVVFTKPWTTRLVYKSRPDVQISAEWVCNEPHRDVSAIVGARQ